MWNYVLILVSLSGCIESSNKRFLVDNQQPSPLPAAVYDDIHRQLDDLRSQDATQEREMAKISGRITDLNTHLSRSDALINDLITNQTTCHCLQTSNNNELSSYELRNISHRIDVISHHINQTDLETKNLSSITGIDSAQVSGIYHMLEEFVSLPAAHELKDVLQNSNLETIFGNITTAHAQSNACNCNMSALNTLDKKYQSTLLDLNNIKSQAAVTNNKVLQQEVNIQSLQQKLAQQDQTLNAKDVTINDMKLQINKLSQELSRQEIVIQNFTSEKTSISVDAASLDDKIKTQSATIQDMSNTMKQQQHFITNLIGWLKVSRLIYVKPDGQYQAMNSNLVKHTVKLPCTTGSVHNLCPMGSHDIFFHNQFHETPSISASASIYHIPTRAVVGHVTPTLTNVTPRGFRMTVACESDSTYAIEATWKACVIPIVEDNAN